MSVKVHDPECALSRDIAPERAARHRDPIFAGQRLSHGCYYTPSRSTKYNK